jgi:hypothetical protein
VALIGDSQVLSRTNRSDMILEGRRFDHYLSSNCTCEVGINLGTGKDYHSVIFLLEQLARTES